METSQMVRQRYSLLLVSIPCKIFVLVDVRAVGAELQPAVVERRSRVAPGCCCCTNVGSLRQRPCRCCDFSLGNPATSLKMSSQDLWL
jgi:hypothetical protein